MAFAVRFCNTNVSKTGFVDRGADVTQFKRTRSLHRHRDSHQELKIATQCWWLHQPFNAMPSGRWCTHTVLCCRQANCTDTNECNGKCSCRMCWWNLLLLVATDCVSATSLGFKSKLDKDKTLLPPSAIQNYAVSYHKNALHPDRLYQSTCHAMTLLYKHVLDSSSTDVSSTDFHFLSFISYHLIKNSDKTSALWCCICWFCLRKPFRPNSCQYPFWARALQELTQYVCMQMLTS